MPRTGVPPNALTSRRFAFWHIDCRSNSIPQHSHLQNLTVDFGELVATTKARQITLDC